MTGHPDTDFKVNAELDGSSSCCMWWTMWRALVHCVADDVFVVGREVVGSGKLCGGWCVEHRYTMWWMT